LIIVSYPSHSEDIYKSEVAEFNLECLLFFTLPLNSCNPWGTSQDEFNQPGND